MRVIKKAFSLILTASLIFSSIPAEAISRSFLAPPGNSELLPSIIELQNADKQKQAHPSFGREKIVEQIQESAQNFGVTIPPNTNIILHVAKKMKQTITFKVFNEIVVQLQADEKLSMPYFMVPFPIPDGDKEKYRQLVFAMKQGLEVADGSQVTGMIAGTPFKKAGVGLLDEKDSNLRDSAGVLVLRDSGRLWGAFTDGEALVAWFEKAFGTLKGKRVVLLGSGAVGSSIARTESIRQVKELVVADKVLAQAKSIISDLRLHDININASYQTADDPENNRCSRNLHQKLAEADVVINATGHGRVPSEIKSPLVDNESVRLRYKNDAVVVDLDLFLEKDNFLTQASKVTPSVRTADGVGMMIEQNTRQFAILFGWEDNDPRMEHLRNLIRVAAVRQQTERLRDSQDTSSQNVAAADNDCFAVVSSEVDLNNLSGRIKGGLTRYLRLLLSKTYANVLKIVADKTQDDAYGFESKDRGIFGAIVEEARYTIEAKIKEWHDMGIRVMLHSGIGGQALGNRALLEPAAYNLEWDVIVLEKLGYDFKQIFDDLEEKGIAASQICLHVSSKTGITDETMINFQGGLKTFIMRLSKEKFGDERVGLELTGILGGLGDLTTLGAEEVEALNLSDKAKTLLQEVFGRIIFTTTLGEEAGSRLYAFARCELVRSILGPAGIPVVGIPDNIGGRFSERSPSGDVTSSFAGRDIFKISQGAREVLDIYTSADANINPALKAACYLYLLNPDYIVVAVQASNMRAVASALSQKFPESWGKGGKGPMVLVCVGQRMLDKLAQAMENYSAAFILINVEGEKVKPLVLNSSTIPYLTYTQMGLGEKEEARRLLFSDVFTKWFGELNAAAVTGDYRSSIYRPLDFQIQPFVDIGKKLMEESAADLSRDEAKRIERYRSFFARARRFPQLFRSRGITPQTSLARMFTLRRDIGSLPKSQLPGEPIAEEDEEFLACVNEIKNLMAEQARCRNMLQTHRIDNGIFNQFAKIAGYGSTPQPAYIEKPALSLALLCADHIIRGKIPLPIFYTHQVEAEILGRWYKYIMQNVPNEYGIGTREQHSYFQTLLGGKDVALPILVDVFTSLESVRQTQEPIWHIGLAQDYLKELYPDEVRRLYLEAEFAAFASERVPDKLKDKIRRKYARDCAILRIWDLSTDNGLIEAFRFFGRFNTLLSKAVSLLHQEISIDGWEERLRKRLEEKEENQTAEQIMLTTDEVLGAILRNPQLLNLELLKALSREPLKVANAIWREGRDEPGMEEWHTRTPRRDIKQLRRDIRQPYILWNKIHMLQRLETKRVSAEEWLEISRNAVSELINMDIQVAKNHRALFSLLFDDQGLPVYLNGAPEEFLYHQVGDERENLKELKGTVPGRAFRLRGTLEHPLHEPQGFLGFEPSTDKESFLRLKLNRAELNEEDIKSFPKLAMTECIRAAEFFAPLIHPDKPLVLSDDFIEMFAHAGINIPKEDLTVSKFLQMVKAKGSSSITLSCLGGVFAIPSLAKAAGITAEQIQQILELVIIIGSVGIFIWLVWDYIIKKLLSSFPPKAISGKQVGSEAEETVPVKALSFQEFKDKQKRIVIPQVISSMEEIVTVSLDEISKLEKQAQSKELDSDEKHALDIYWRNVAKAALILSYFKHEKVEGLAKMIFSTPYTYAKGDALRALANLHPQKAADLAKVWVREGEAERDILDACVEAIFSGKVEQWREKPQEIDPELEPVLRFCGIKPEDEIVGKDREDIFRHSELKHISKEVVAVLTRIKDRTALPMIKRLIASGYDIDNIRGANLSIAFGSSELIPALKETLESIDAHFAKLVREHGYDLDNPDSWASGRLFRDRSAQIALARAIALLGDKTYALPKLKEWLEFHLRLEEKGRDRFDSSYSRSPIYDIAEILIKIGELKYIVPKLRSFYKELEDIGERVVGHSFVEPIGPIKSYEYFDMHGVALLLVEARDKSAFALVQKLWQRAIVYGHAWMSLLAAVEALPLTSAADFLKAKLAIWKNEVSSEHDLDARNVAKALVELGDEAGIDYFMCGLVEPLIDRSKLKHCIYTRFKAVEAMVETSLGLAEPIEDKEQSGDDKCACFGKDKRLSTQEIGQRAKAHVLTLSKDEIEDIIWQWKASVSGCDLYREIEEFQENGGRIRISERFGALCARAGKTIYLDRFFWDAYKAHKGEEKKDWLRLFTFDKKIRQRQEQYKKKINRIKNLFSTLLVIELAQTLKKGPLKKQSIEKVLATIKGLRAYGSVSLDNVPQVKDYLIKLLKNWFEQNRLKPEDVVIEEFLRLTSLAKEFSFTQKFLIEVIELVKDAYPEFKDIGEAQDLWKDLAIAGFKKCKYDFNMDDWIDVLVKIFQEDEARASAIKKLFGKYFQKIEHLDVTAREYINKIFQAYKDKKGPVGLEGLKDALLYKYTTKMALGILSSHAKDINEVREMVLTYIAVTYESIEEICTFLRKFSKPKKRKDLINHEVIAALVDEFVKAAKQSWRIGCGWGKIGMDISIDTLDVKDIHEYLFNFYYRRWNEIVSLVSDNLSSVTLDAWQNIASRAFLEILEHALRLAENKIVIFNLFIGRIGIEELYVVPQKFIQFDDVHAGINQYDRKGEFLTNSALRGTVKDRLNAKTGFIRIDPAADKNAYLERKLDKKKLTAEDGTKYEEIVVQDIIQAVSLLVQAAHADKKLRLLDSVTEMFKNQGIFLPEQLTITKFTETIGDPKKYRQEKKEKPPKAVKFKEVRTPTHARYPVRITNPSGLHMMVAGEIVTLSENFKSVVIITKEKDGTKANTRSLEKLMELAAGRGSTVIIEAKGEDALNAAQAIENSLKTHPTEKALRINKPRNINQAL